MNKAKIIKKKKSAKEIRQYVAKITRRKLGFKDSEKLKAGDMIGKLNLKKKLLKAGI